MKNDNSKPPTISKINEAKYKFKADQHRPLKQKKVRDGIRCLGGVDIPC